MASSRQEDLNQILLLARKSASGLRDFYREENSILFSLPMTEDKNSPSLFENFLRCDMLDTFDKGLGQNRSESKGLIKQVLNSLFKTGKWNEIFAKCFIEFILRHPDLIDQEDRDKFIAESFRMHALTKAENTEDLASATTQGDIAYHLLLPEIALSSYFHSAEKNKPLFELLFNLYFENLFEHSSEQFIKQALDRLLAIESWNSIFASNFIQFVITHPHLFDDEDNIKIIRRLSYMGLLDSATMDLLISANGGIIYDETKDTPADVKREPRQKQLMALTLINSLEGGTIWLKGQIYAALMDHGMQPASSIEDTVNALLRTNSLPKVQADYAELMNPDAPLLCELSSHIENTTGKRKAATLAERGELYYQYALLSGDPKHLQQAFEDFRDATLVDATPNKDALKRIVEINQDIQEHFAPSSTSTAKTKSKENFLSLDDESESESTLSDERERKTTLPITSHQYQRATQIPGSEPYLKAIAPVAKAIQILHNGIENEEQAIAKKQEEAKAQPEAKRTPKDSKRQEENIRDIVRAEAALELLLEPIKASTNYTDPAAHNAWHYLWMWNQFYNSRSLPIVKMFKKIFNVTEDIKHHCVPPQYLFYFLTIDNRNPNATISIIKYMFGSYLNSHNSTTSRLDRRDPTTLVNRILEIEVAIRPYASSNTLISDALLEECWKALIEQFPSELNVEKRLTLLDKAKEQLLDNINRINNKDLKKTIYAEFHRQYELVLKRTEQDRAKIHPAVGSQISIDDIRKYLENDIQRTKAKIGFETFNTHWYRDRKAPAKLTAKLTLLEDLKRKIDSPDFITTLDTYAKQMDGVISSVTAKRLRQYHTDLTRHAPSPKPSRSVESKRG